MKRRIGFVLVMGVCGMAHAETPNWGMAESADIRIDCRDTFGGRLVSGTQTIGTVDGASASVWDTAAESDGWHERTDGDMTAALYSLNGETVSVVGGRLAGDAMWTSNATHVVRNWIYIPRGVTLTVATNAVVKFCPGVGIRIEDGGRLDVVGAAGADAVFTSVLDGTAGAALAGLGSVTNAATGGIVAQSSAATFTDNGFIQTRGFTSVPNYGTVSLHGAVVERSEGAAYVAATIATSRRQPFSLDWRAVDGTATFGEDYTLASGTLTWNSSDEGTKLIRVPLNTEKKGERRSFTVEIATARGILVDSTPATVEIGELDAAKTMGEVQLHTNVMASAAFDVDADIAERRIMADTNLVVRHSALWDTDARGVNCTARVTLAANGGRETDVVVGERGQEGDCEIDLTQLAPGPYTLRHRVTDETGWEVSCLERSFNVVDFTTTELHGGTLSCDETWTTGKVHVVTADVVVPSGVSLTIMPGAVVKFMTGTSLRVKDDGSCTAKGVVFTHVDDDTVGGDVLCDGGRDAVPMGDYAISGSLIDDDTTEYRYLPPQLLTSNVSGDVRLRGHRTYIVSNSVTVASGATVTISAGAILKFNVGCSLTVNGSLDVRGTRAAPVVFTSLKDDAHGGDTNGDGDATYPQAGDWYQIRVKGTADFDYAQVLYNSSNENYGGLEAYGGTVNFRNGQIAHSEYECVNAHSSGMFMAENSVFMDASLGFGYYGSGRVKAVNCVFADLTTAIRQSGKGLKNCVFYRCVNFTDQGGDGSSFDHCLFYNPPDFGAQSYGKVGSNGNIWGDPGFVDPDNGDFRILAASPCVDAGDGTSAPGTDMWGRPRMDVTAVEDVGIPNADGICPDIGVYEIGGWTAVEPADFALVGFVSMDMPGGEVSPGDEIKIAYTVTNLLKTAGGTWRDRVLFVSDTGRTVEVAVVESSGIIRKGAAVTFSRSVRVPAVDEGSWRVAVDVNPWRDVFEKSGVDNNFGVSEEAVKVVLPSASLSETATGVVDRGGVDTAEVRRAV